MKLLKHLTLFCIFFSIASCDYFIKDDEGQNKTILVLFDLSESTNKPEARKLYSGGFNTILSRVTHGDAVFAGWITERSGVELELVVSYIAEPFEPPTDNPLILRRLRDEANLALSDTLQLFYNLVDSLLHNPTRRVMNTDILSSLDLAERIFKSFPENRRILVLFSDMIEDSYTYNFERENLTQQRIDAIIRTENENNRIPELDGVVMYVIGAYHRDVNRFRMIRDFWFAFFEECGAVLNRENYGPQLITFEE